MVGLGGGRGWREGEASAVELEVARILVVLPRLVWEADHGPPCTHNLRWGARKRRSACAEDDEGATVAASLLPPPRLGKKLGKRHGSRDGEATAEAAKSLPSQKGARHEARDGGGVAEDKRAEEAGADADAAKVGTSSPETPLDFYPSAEEADATAGVPVCTTDIALPPAKKPRLKHDFLSKQVDQLNRSRTELQREAEEIRKRLEALRASNTELMQLRAKLAEQRKHQMPPDCMDLLPTEPVRSAGAGHAPDRTHPQPQQQKYQQGWAQHWVNNHTVFHQVASGFSIHPAPAAAGSQGWTWPGSQAAWRTDGDGKVLSLNSGVGLNLAFDSQQQQQQQNNHYYYQQQQQQQQQQNNHYYYQQQQQEQKAARKKRIQMLQQRRNAAAAVPAGGTSAKVARFR